MLKTGMTAQTEITDYTADGQGICRIDGCAVFVPNAIKGEVCEVRIVKAGKNTAVGKIEKIVEKSFHRIPRDCPYAKLCGGCQFRHMDYAAECELKEHRVRTALERIGGVEFNSEFGIRNSELPQEKAFSLRRRCPEGADEVSESCHPERSEGSASDDRGEILRRAAPQDDTNNSEFGIRSSELKCLQVDELNVGRGLDRAADRSRPFPAASYTEFLPIVPSAQTESYRNKAQYPVAAQRGKPVAGFYKERTHQVVPIDRCRILPQESDDAKACVVRWMEQFHIASYDETTGRGLIRHIYARKGFVSGEVLVCIVANGGTLPHEKELTDALKKNVKGLKTVVLSVNHKQGNAVLGDQFIPLYGDGYIEDTLCGLRFRLSPRSFYQVNHDQAERLYAAACDAAQLTGKETVLDLYCGTGTITLCLARHAGKVYGVEIIEQAIEDAKENAKRNGIENAEFFCADAGQAAARFAADGIKPDVIVIDPPRKGVSPDVIDAMVKMAPERIVYVSCDPATLARDVKLLTERGYCVRTAQPFDLFPRTAHVETVVLLSQLRQKPDDYIDVDIDVAELEGTSAETKATYEKIKKYVAEHNDGMKVSSLNIAQVKRKCGIELGENYNLPKSEDSKQPQCPKEKEEAIIEALKEFQMI